MPLLSEGLERLEPQLTASVVTGDTFLDDVTTHLIAAGGKRLRPLLALACATAGREAATNEDLMGAVAVELVHLASLYHDDVLDEATSGATSRASTAASATWWPSWRGLPLGPIRRHRRRARYRHRQALADTLGKLCQGQVLEVRSAFQIDRTSSDSYLSAIAGKTAALTAPRAVSGCSPARASSAEVEAFSEYGLCFGMVFQIRDDILDITATEGELLKPAGQDLAEGIYTLPALVALEDPDSGSELRTLLGKPLGQPERDKACAIVAASPGIAAAVGQARSYVEHAKAATAGIDAPELRDGLARLASELLADLPA